MINEIKSARNRAGLSQRDFALALQISARTLQEWEQGRRSPSGSARALINIALKHPDVIRGSFEAQHEQKLRASAMLDDMATKLLAGDEIGFSDLILDWHREGLVCDSVRRPEDKDMLRLAVKASVVERLAEVLNSPPHKESQTPAPWCDSIDSLKEPVKLQSARLLEDEDYCETFKKRNLYVVSNFMFFV